MEPIYCWHGSQRWTGRPDVQPSAKGRYECGPGIYLTTHRGRASQYAKGAGSLVVVELDPNTRFLESARLTRAQMEDALESMPHMRNRKKVKADLDASAAHHPDGLLPACYLVNFCIDHNALGGEAGPELARWLSSNGIDASLHSPTSGEEWVVVFNPAVIKSSLKVSSKQADDHPWEFDSVKGRFASAPKARPRGP